jgi:hypothetical protein
MVLRINAQLTEIIFMNVDATQQDLLERSNENAAVNMKIINAV